MSHIHPADAKGLANLIRELRTELKKLEHDPMLRNDFFQGRKKIQFPWPVPDGGVWVELRVIDISEVVDDAENRRPR